MDMVGSLVEKKKSSWFAGGVVFLLLTAFVVGSVQDPLSFFHPSIMKVSSRSVSLEEFRGLFFQKYGMVRMLKESGYQVSDEIQFVLNEILKDLVVDAEVRQMGLEVSDQFAKEALADNPAFQGSNGQFDEKKFREHLVRKGVGFKAFMDMTKRTISEKRLKDAILAQVVVPDTMKELLIKGWFQKRIAYYKPFYFEREKVVPLDTGKRDLILKPLFEKAQLQSPEKRTVLVLEVPQSGKGLSSEDWLVKAEDELARHKTLEAAAKALSLVCLRKELIQEDIKEFSQGFLKKVFACKQTDSPELIQDDTGKTFFVMVEKIVPKSPMTYAQALPLLEKTYLEQQKKERALISATNYQKNKVSSLARRLNEGKPVDGFVSLEPFSMEELSSKEPEAFKEAAMRLQKGGHTIVQDSKGCYLIYLAQVEDPAPEALASEKIEKYAIQELQGRFWQDYVKDLLKKHSHTIDQVALDKFLKELRRG
ncbi:MAG: hypothetical protein BGO07_03070 [Alphaproteobacteria bacterium 40-19]|nr:MAG: hypothetical protein BGO07_03070 [Alphaproteobacteria bacterium 40-19]